MTAPLDVFDCPLAGTRLIEASAGTGKTWNICGLYLRLLLERALEVQQILVVTFTNAATAELRERIRARIVETLARLRGAAPPARPLRRRPAATACAPARPGRRGHGAAAGRWRCRPSTKPRSSRSTASASARWPTRRSHRHADGAGAAERRQRAAARGGARLLAPPYRRRHRCRRRWPPPAGAQGHAASAWPTLLGRRLAKPLSLLLWPEALDAPSS